MATYLLSDLHLGHDNIIEYCDRPFADVEDMNQTLVVNWNDAVDPDDEVIYGGDLTIAGTAAAFLEWTSKLNGDIVFLVGNHDRTVVETLDRVSVLEHYRFSHGGCDFYCTHRPEDVPRNWDGWSVFGHHHNNYPDEFPFLDPETRRINISIELLDYEPVPIETIIECIERGERLETAPKR